MAGCLQTLRQEFRVKNFFFSDAEEGRFFSFQWRIPPVVFILYRLIIAVYVDVWFIYLSVNAKSTNGLPWGVFLTVWTYALLALYLTLHAGGAVIYYCCSHQGSSVFRVPLPEHHELLFREESSHGGYQQISSSEEEVGFRARGVPWSVKVIWILFNAVTTSAVVVTLVFFAFLFPQMEVKDAGSPDNLQLHILNSVFIFIEHLLTGVPVRLLHVICPFFYCLIYMFFSVFYWIPDHKRVMYPGVLDWNDPGHTILMVLLVGFVIVPIIHSLFFGIFKLKMYIFKKI